MNNPDEYYHSVPGFRDICLGLASDWFDHEVDHHPDSEELIRGIVESHMLHPPDDSEKFSPSVNRYVNMVLRREGFAKLPGAFEAFGFHPDPGVDWGADLSTDPDLASLAQAGHDDRHAEFVDAFSSWLLELADRLERLPLHTIKNAKAVADDIRKRVPSVPAE